MRFFFCLRESISDLVSCPEADKVACFICGERGGVDSKNLSDFIAKTLLQ